MARIQGELLHGLTVGKDTYKDFELHDHLTAGQIIAAKEASEKVVPFNENGRIVPTVVESPARLGALILGQQVARIGKIAGPLDYDLLKTLHQDDLDVLNLHADLAAGAIDAKELSATLTKMAQQAAPETSQRGRDEGSGRAMDGDGKPSNQEARSEPE